MASKPPRPPIAPKRSSFKQQSSDRDKSKDKNNKEDKDRHRKSNKSSDKENDKSETKERRGRKPKSKKDTTRSRSHPSSLQASPVDRAVSQARSTPTMTGGGRNTRSTASSSGHRRSSSVNSFPHSRAAYFERLSQPRQRRTKKVLDQNNVAEVELTPEEIERLEKKAKRDAKIEKMWMDGIRPNVRAKDKPDFVVNFTATEISDLHDEEVKKSKQHRNRGGGRAQRQAFEEEKEAKERAEKERQKLEQKWLNGLRPSFHSSDKKSKKDRNRAMDFNLDTTIQREPSPEPLFPSDDEYEYYLK